MDESSLTGESHLMPKDSYENCIKINNNNMTPIILSGTDCIEGNGKAVIICVGEKRSKSFVLKPWMI